MNRYQAAMTAVLIATPFGRPASAADAAHPAVIELFQSQGCSSCPPTNENVMALADRPELLTLSWQVTYWDDLGWKDTFDDAAFTQRQRDYAAAFHRDNVFTPEVVVNGRADGVGNPARDLQALIRKNDRGSAGPEIVVRGDRVTLSGDRPDPDVIVLLVRYNPNIIQVPILRGENGGRTLPHRNVVREITQLDKATDAPQSYVLPPPGTTGLKSAILVQAGRGGLILAALRL